MNLFEFGVIGPAHVFTAISIIQVGTFTVLLVKIIFILILCLFVCLEVNTAARSATRPLLDWPSQVTEAVFVFV